MGGRILERTGMRNSYTVGEMPAHGPLVNVDTCGGHSLACGSGGWWA